MILNSNFSSQDCLSLPNTLLRLLSSVEHGEEQTQIRFTKNLAGKSFIIGDGTDVYVTFINCNATKDHCTYINEIPHERTFKNQTCLNHLQKALIDLLTLISKIVLENGTN